MKRLKGKIISIDQLTSDLCQTFFDIYQTYFENVTYDNFTKHISHKDSVIVLYDSKEKIQGFSTIKVICDEIEGKKTYGIFSGDTIIHKSYWGEQELVRQFSHYAGKIASGLQEGEKLYWLLISKGYKTYRYLPVFFDSFYPHYKEPWPKLEKKVHDHFYSRLYPNEFAMEKGLITFNEQIGNLKKDVGDIDNQRIQDPHVAYFAQRNPDHMKGVELTCLAELCEKNMKSIAQIFFSKGLKSSKAKE